jgi:predicted ATP-dependent protease
VQAIGGVNEKVEGFFRVCRAQGLSGSQGVMIPAANVEDLHLDHEAAAAVAEGRFNVWAVDTIADGIELLSGRPAGTWEDATGWSEGSLYEDCQQRLEEMVRLMRQAAKGEGKSPESDQNGTEEIDDNDEKPDGKECL